MSLDAIAMRRATQELAISKSAEAEAEESSKAVQVSQKELMAKMALEEADQSFQQSASTWPEVRAAITETRLWALKAQRHADHAKQVLAMMKNVPDVVAKRVVETVQQEIKREAYDTAERTAKVAPETPKELGQRVAKTAAAAAEPQFLALLRAQKAAKETYEKAKGAADSFFKLVKTAKEQGKTAQVLQAGGKGVLAVSMMSKAHGTMQAALNMKTWANKLYAQANALEGSLGYWQLNEGQAAASAVAGVAGHTVHEFPEMPGPP